MAEKEERDEKNQTETVVQRLPLLLAWVPAFFDSFLTFGQPF
jgi:hypothetical protein